MRALVPAKAVSSALFRLKRLQLYQHVFGRRYYSSEASSLVMLQPIPATQRQPPVRRFCLLTATAAFNNIPRYTAFVWPNAPPGVRALQPAVAPESKDDTCGGNCPNGCSSCPCGSTPAIIDSGHWCSQGLSSGWEQDSCECIIQASSRLNAAASTESFDGSFSLGMFQTWAAANTTTGCDPADRCARCAFM